MKNWAFFYFLIVLLILYIMFILIFLIISIKKKQFAAAAAAILICIIVVITPFDRYYESVRFLMLKNKMEQTAVNIIHHYVQTEDDKTDNIILPEDLQYLSRYGGEVLLLHSGQSSAVFSIPTAYCSTVSVVMLICPILMPLDCSPDTPIGMI